MFMVLRLDLEHLQQDGVAYMQFIYIFRLRNIYTILPTFTSGIQSQKILVMDDDSTAYSQEYAIMYGDSLLVSVGATVKSGNVETLVTPETGVSGIVTYRFTSGDDDLM